MLEVPGRFPANVLGGGSTEYLINEGKEKQTGYFQTGKWYNTLLTNLPLSTRMRELTAHGQDPAGGVPVDNTGSRVRPDNL